MIRPVIRSTGLTFPWLKVQEALSEVRAASEFRPLYGDKTGPGLWLVGDDGVYLMPNTISKARMIVFARECDPAIPQPSWVLESTEILGRGLMPPSLFLRLETGQADHG